ncbi:potassium efflux system KefA protein [Klebsiella grimontii]|uniref:Potassium efflux system KefA protein n=1 Tax=Klebsiella grimontii TaxID=2058152 RepID=A0A7H4PBM5_9ENTR|nr:potassium efflux system KefA protein [Klebsiella grimontii]
MLIAILVLIITTQLVRNLPALLELAILQHLELTPGTGYAITTITKYLLMLIGGLVGFSMIGIEWSKLQWLIAALGVGLGFGLQEIFANFISGLIILFEKPIRIGDTVTIRDLTGSVTRINTRATTISDWDRKEIIVPNKAFITEQFINWSLSDSVTRVVLTVPAPVDANTEEVAQILLNAAHRCSLVIDTPAPEAFLVDLQQGIQIFELRIYAAEMGHRMPLRHEMHQLILAGFREHGIDMPFPPFQMRLESIDGRKSSRALTSAGKTQPHARQPVRTALPESRQGPERSHYRTINHTAVHRRSSPVNVLQESGKEDQAPVDGKRDNVADAFCAQRQHHHPVNAQRYARNNPAARLPRGSQQMMIDGLAAAGREPHACGYPAQNAAAVRGRR